MKSLVNIGALVCLTLILNHEGFAGKKDVEKKKVVEKSFNVSGSTTFSVKNSFGRVHIESWNESKIDVKVEVIARKKNDDRAQETLDKIEIDISESSGEVSFTTNFKGQMNKSNNNDNFEVNYMVRMPSGNPLNLSNAFGDSFIGDRSGDNDIKISYGDFRIENLKGKSDVKISFSDGDIKAVETGEVVIKYSDVNIDRLGMVKLEDSFSDTDIGTAGTIQLTSKYGDLDIDEVVGIKGKASFSDVDIDALEKEAVLETSYGGLSIDDISKDFSVIDIRGKFGGMNLEFSEGTNAIFNVKTKFCEFKDSNSSIEMNYRVKESSSGDYRGVLGNGNGGTINVVTSYGDVTFR